MITFWQENCINPDRKRCIQGSIGGLWTPSQQNDIKVKVTENGNSDVFVVKRSIQKKTDVFTSMEDSAISTGQNLKLNQRLKTGLLY